MLQVYVNYPNPAARVHGDSSCNYIGMHGKPGQRRLRVDTDCFAEAIGQIDAMPFRAEPEANDLWLEVDFGDPQFERALVEHLLRRLGRRYRPLGKLDLETHC